MSIKNIFNKGGCLGAFESFFSYQCKRLYTLVFWQKNAKKIFYNMSC